MSNLLYLYHTHAPTTFKWQMSTGISIGINFVLIAGHRSIVRYRYLIKGRASPVKGRGINVHERILLQSVTEITLTCLWPHKGSRGRQLGVFVRLEAELIAVINFQALLHCLNSPRKIPHKEGTLACCRDDYESLSPSP